MSAPVKDSINLAPRMIDRAANWYATPHTPATFRDVPPLLARHVEQVTGGDWHRCILEPDGAITITNHRVW